MTHLRPGFVQGLENLENNFLKKNQGKLGKVRARSLVVRDLRLEAKVRLLAMCRGELSAVIARLISKCL